MKIIKILFIITLPFLFIGCSQKYKSNSYYKHKLYKHNNINKNNQQRQHYTNNKKYQNILSEYYKWKGVKYRYGGTTKNGIDCSAFTQKIYRNALNKKIPRTTKEQNVLGNYVSLKNIKIGDLIFFKTGYNSRHVGIYIGNNDFIHASTSKGVTTSSINNSYWKKHYWKIKRL